jgi:hypothetical protein
MVERLVSIEMHALATALIYLNITTKLSQYWPSPYEHVMYCNGKLTFLGVG